MVSTCRYENYFMVANRRFYVAKKYLSCWMMTIFLEQHDLLRLCLANKTRLSLFYDVSVCGFNT